MDERNIPEHWPDERKDALRNMPRASAPGELEPGSAWVVNGLRDLYMSPELRPFIGQIVRIVQRNKGGKYMVELPDGRRESFAKHDLDPVSDAQPIFISGTWPQSQVIARATFRAPIEHAQFSGMVTRPKCCLCGDYIYDEVESERGVPLINPARIAHVRCAIAVKSEKSA